MNGFAGSVGTSPLLINADELVVVAVAGQIAHPVMRASPYRIGHDGVPRILPGTGGIVLNQRIGDRCVGLAGDHIEPGVAVSNPTRDQGGRASYNLALLTHACIGNRALVISGPCAGQWGVVTGKHGGIDHVLVDFPPAVLRRLRIRDQIQIYSVGLGLRLVEYPSVQVSNCSPALLRAWGIQAAGHELHVPVTHCVPAAIMGSGLGKNNTWQGDYDIQLFDPAMRQRFRLDCLRFGDLVAILDADGRFGPSYQQGRITIGVVVHGDSTVSGHGPGVTTLLTGSRKSLRPVRNSRANLAEIFGLRVAPPARPHAPLAGRARALTEQRVIAGRRDGEELAASMRRVKSRVPAG